MKYTFFLLLSILQVPLLAQRPKLVLPIGQNMITSVAFSPDGRYVLTGSGDNTAKLWDPSGHEISTFGHEQYITSIAFAPDGQSILTGSADRTAKLWSLNGQEIQTFSGHSGRVHSVAFAPDGHTILTGSEDATVKLWTLDGQEIQTFSGHSNWVHSVAFAPDGQTILTGSADKTARIWALDGREIQTFSHNGGISSVAFAPDGQFVLTGSEAATVKLWTLDGQEIQTFSGDSNRVYSAVFSPDGQSILIGGSSGTYLFTLDGRLEHRFYVSDSEGPSRLVFRSVAFSSDGQYILAGGDYSAQLWALDGRIIQSFSSHTSPIHSVAFSPDGQYLLTGSYVGEHLWTLDGQEIQTFSRHVNGVFSPDGRYILNRGSDAAKLWTLDGQEIQTFRDGVNSAVFSPDGRYILTGGKEATAKLWTLDGREIQTFSHNGGISSAVFSPDGQFVLTGSEDATVKLWTLDGQEIQTFSGHSNSVYSVVFSPDGRYILTRDSDAVRLWALDGQEIQTFRGHSNSAYSAVFSPDGQFVLTGDYATAKLWTLDGREIQTFSGYSNIRSAVFSPDGQFVLTGSEDATVKLWTLDGQEIQTFRGHSNRLNSVAISPDGQYVLTGSDDFTTKLWERSSGAEIATLIVVDTTDWVVTTPSGLFDASPGAMRRMHYVQGLEVIALEQLKERYYEPGLLAKLMGYNPEPIRDVSAMDQQLELYPDVALTLQGERLDIALATRGGGIGRVALYVDNKEVIGDVDPDRGTTIRVDLKPFEKYFQAGQPARVGVQAWDRAGSLASQIHRISVPWGVSSKGDGNKPAANPSPSGGNTAQPIRLFALCIGSGDYSGGTDLDLSYAEQDARQMGQALELAGKELFLAGPPEVRLLTTCKDCPDAASAEFPSKANIRRALEDIAEKAGPQDVVLLYLSGHGITYEDYWYYLTYEMSSSVMTDKLVREQRTISSSELKEWLAAIPARKQVMIIDACASGKLNQDFDLLSQKDVPSSQIRALNRLGTRGGLYVISASTADQVSYEASPYGMGLLTYGLLQGMQGPSLRESEFIDIDLLFSYAEDQVPKFANYINKAQKPMVYAPEGSESFDIGRVTAAVKQSIELAEPKPLFAKANFVNPKKQYRDDLKLSNAVNTALRDYNYKGQKSPLIFVEADDMPQAYTLTGAYTVDGEAVNLEATLFKGEEQIGATISLTGSTGDLAGLSRKLIAEAARRVR